MTKELNHWDQRIKTLMEQVGHPDSMSLYQAFKQLQNELALRPQADHPDTARCIKARNDLNAALHGEGLVTDDLEHLGIEAIASGIMGVAADASPRYLEMLEVARGYLAELEEAAQSPQERLEHYKQSLAARLVPYADNPAFQAVLEAERADKLGR